MKTLLRNATWLAAGVVLGAGALLGAQRALHEEPRPRPSLAEIEPAMEPPAEPVAASTPGPVAEPPAVEPVAATEPAAVTPASAWRPAEPAPVAEPAAPSASPAVAADAGSPPSPPPAEPVEFFGFPVASLDRRVAEPTPVSAPVPAPVPAAAVAAPPPAPAPSPAAPPARLRFVPIAGRCAAGFDAKSTLHDFRGWTKNVAGFVEFEAGRIEETASARFVVDARTLDTGNPDRDAEMHQDHLQTKDHPEMTFALAEFRRDDPARTDGRFVMKGKIGIHGRERDVEIAGTCRLRADGWLHVKAEFPLKMSDFGIAPPVTALVVKVEDGITAWFEVWAKRQEAGK